MTDPTLAAQIEALAAKATPGDWFASKPYGDEDEWLNCSIGGYPLRENKEAHYEDTILETWGINGNDPAANAALICLLRNNLPAIVTALRQAEAAPGVVEELRSGANNVEQARMQNTTGYLAGWEHLTMRKAADTIAALGRQHGAREQAQTFRASIKGRECQIDSVAELLRLINGGARIDLIAALSATAATPSDEEVRLREALEVISEGDVPRTEGKKWREDGGHSKHDQCSHGMWMYEHCGECTSDFARAALEPQDKDERPDFVAWRSASFAHGDIIEVRERNGHTHLMQVGSPRFNAALIDLGDLMPVRTATAEQRKPWFRN